MCVCVVGSGVAVLGLASALMVTGQPPRLTLRDVGLGRPCTFLFGTTNTLLWASDPKVNLVSAIAVFSFACVAFFRLSFFASLHA